MSQQEDDQPQGMTVEVSSAPGASDNQPTEASVTTTTNGTMDATTTTAINVNSPSNQSTTTKEETRKDWDHSNRKFMVTNLYKFEDARKMKKLTAQWIQTLQQQSPMKIVIDKIKKPPKESWMILVMKDESMVQPLMDFINQDKTITNKRGVKLIAKRITENTDGHKDGRNNTNKRARNNDKEPVTKRQKMGTDKSAYVQKARRPLTDDEIRNVITPLWQQTPQEQIDTKMKELVKKCALKINKEIKSRFRTISKEKSRKHKVPVYEWLTKERIVDLQPVVPVPSPVRNKCEFTFGYRYLFDTDADQTATTTNDDGTSKTTEPNDSTATTDPPSTTDTKTPACRGKVASLGFMATGWAGGVVRPHVCDNISSEACAIVDVVDDFLKTSPLPPYDSREHVGMWKTLTVRSSRRTRECMVIITHSPASGGAGEKEDTTIDYAQHFDSEKERLVSVLLAAELPVPDQDPMKVTSVFFQEYDDISHPGPDHPVQHVYGKTYLSEQVGKCTFQISPGAFFQVNTAGAEILFSKVVEKVREVCKDAGKTLLFDVCCGTGTIGLTCMKEGVVGHVVGVDISEPAIRDARRNASLNGFGDDSSEEQGSNVDICEQKVKFVAGRAEDVLAKEIGKAKESGLHFVAVVDPAREGLHPDVLRTLRLNKRIDRVVYVSCNPTGSLVRDVGLLCAPPTKRYGGLPFRIESAVPVDMFPLTSHCEMVMTFDRLTAEEEAARG